MPSPASQSKRAAWPAPFISSCHCSFCPPFVWSVSSSLGFQLVVMKGFGVSVMQPPRIIPFDEFSQTGWNVRWSKLHSYSADRRLQDKFQVEKVWRNLTLFFLRLRMELISTWFFFLMVHLPLFGFWVISTVSLDVWMQEQILPTLSFLWWQNNKWQLIEQCHSSVKLVPNTSLETQKSNRPAKMYFISP